jgi:hypothetical protein
MAVLVEVAGVRLELHAGEPFTFGRDAAVCTVCLGVDPVDRGISRLAGSITHDNGVWWISNRSTSRCLHVVDLETGIAVPLPVTRDNWPAARHPVDRPTLAVLVAGEVLVHEIVVTASGSDLPVPEKPPDLADPLPTRKLLPPLTDKQREALVAMCEGYLLRFPRYNPEPRTYDEAAGRLGLPSTTVKKRIENVRHQLMEAGVAGLESADARRNLAEWLLSNRLITTTDLEWLERRSPSRRVMPEKE